MRFRHRRFPLVALPLFAAGAFSPSTNSPTLPLAAGRIRVAPTRPSPSTHGEALSVGAVQTVYRAGVPHTDRQGNPRHEYDSASFFPRCLYHAMQGSLQSISDAGFNCVHTHESIGISHILDELRSARLQLLKHWPTDEEVRTFALDPRILGWYLDEEPTHRTFLEMARTGNIDLMRQRYETYLSRKAAIKAIDPHHPVFALESGWIPPGHQDWWEQWNRSGDVVAYDHYPLELDTPDIEVLADRVSLAVRITEQKKPVWLTVQAYAGTRAVLPTPEQLRGMVFTAIIHGATGIISFTYDSPVTRIRDVVGIAPDPVLDYDGRGAATPEERSQSRALWRGATALNAELRRLTPLILSPTADLPYAVHYSGQSKTRGPIRTMLKPTKRGYTLFASSIERASLGARFQFLSKIASVRRLEPNGSATALAPNGGVFRDRFGPFSVGVYEITFLPPGAPASPAGSSDSELGAPR
jgi:hypothetical protein